LELADAADKLDAMQARFTAYEITTTSLGTIGRPLEIGTEAGEGYTVNAPLSHGNGDTAVAHLLDEVFLPIARQFKPDVILVSSGYDSHHADQLGGLMLTTNFFGEMLLRFQKIQPKIICTLEGGYNLNWIGKCLLAQLGVLVSHPMTFPDSAYEHSTVQPVIDTLKNELGSYWKL
jgi:acetoin utilization deacetylase AcuC-like enzyme